MSIYEKEEVAYFHRCMKSIYDEQTLKPDEIVLVQDGTLTEELYEAINIWREKLGYFFKTIALDKNIGLGDALNVGLKECSYEIVARMDTDDISLRNRFKKQMDILENNLNIDIVSSWINEFEDDESNIVSIRKIPEYHNEIVQYAKSRNPVNHIPVMFRKKSVINAGGYQKMLFFEDYYLWIRLILNGAKLYNIQESLANIRAGDGQLTRRSGYSYAMNEFDFQKKIFQLGFINKVEFIKNIVVRFTSRILPKKALKIIYRVMREQP